jgi:ABC-2 type transport system permease protein
MTLLELCKHELKAVFTNPVVLMTIFGGVFFYSFLYPQPYLQQTPTEQHVTIVNQDKSLVSLQLERWVDASPSVMVVAHAETIEQAKAQFLAGDVKGILVIPKDFYRDLLLGKSPTLSYSGDAAYFLVYGTIVNGLAKAAGTLGAKAKIARLVMEGVPLSQAMSQYAAVKTNLKPTFNPTMGYVAYVVPAVFILILQQTLVMGAGLLGGTQKHQSGYWQHASPLALLAVRCTIFVAIYYFLAMFYLGFCLDQNHVSRLANPLTLLVLLAPFLLSSSFIGICLGAILPRRELVTFVVLISSMPLVFAAGFIWPLESIPEPMRWLTALFPTTPAIQAFLATNQLGASFYQVMDQWHQLWIQTLGWGALAYACYRRER